MKAAPSFAPSRLCVNYAAGSRKGAKARRYAKEGDAPLRGGRREGGEVLLPGPPRAAGVRFCCPVRPDRAFVLSNSTREGQVTRQSRAPRYRWHLCDGPLRWSHSGRKLRFSTHVDPGSAPSAEPLGRHASCVLPEWLGPSGGAAGYCPRVRCAYDTQHFIAI